jgi:hypothetical protein
VIRSTKADRERTRIAAEAYRRAWEARVKAEGMTEELARSMPPPRGRDFVEAPPVEPSFLSRLLEKVEKLAARSHLRVIK